MLTLMQSVDRKASKVGSQKSEYVLFIVNLKLLMKDLVTDRRK